MSSRPFRKSVLQSAALDKSLMYLSSRSTRNHASEERISERTADVPALQVVERVLVLLIQDNLSKLRDFSARECQIATCDKQLMFWVLRHTMHRNTTHTLLELPCA